MLYINVANRIFRGKGANGLELINKLHVFMLGGMSSNTLMGLKLHEMVLSILCTHKRFAR